MIKKKFYYKNTPEYYIYYTVNDGNPANVDLSDWPEVTRNEIISGQQGRLVLNTVPIYIPDGAFDIFSAGGTNLVNITLPNTITNIGEGAFSGCNYLTSFTLRDEVTTVGASAFNGTGITSPLYNNTIFAYLPQSYSGSYTIPSGITKIIGQAAFGCNGLTSIIIPDSVIEIGYESFAGCNYLTQVEIGTGIINIGHYGFRNIANSGTFTCKAVSPPMIDTSLGAQHSNWTLYVPANSVLDYSNSSAWNNFFSGNIQAIS